MKNRRCAWPCLLALTVACGARTDPASSSATTEGAGGASGDPSGSSGGDSSTTDGPTTQGASTSHGAGSSSSSRCAVASPAGRYAACSSWGMRGDPVDVSGSVFGDSATSIVPSAGGALLAWSNISFFVNVPNPPTKRWSTQALGLDGSARGPSESHFPIPFDSDPPFTAPVLASSTTSCSFGGLVVNDWADACRFIALDEDGHDLGSVARIAPSGSACFSLVAEGADFSTVVSAAGATTVQLVRFGASGVVSARRDLPLPPSSSLDPTAARTVLHDGSFLLQSDVPGSQGSNAVWLQHFAADGAPLASAIEVVPAAVTSVSLVETTGGIVAAWGPLDPSGDNVPLTTQALDVDGRPTAPALTIGFGPNLSLWSFALASAPSGDALLSWIYFPDSSGEPQRLWAVALAPDATPRGPASLLGQAFSFDTNLVALVDATGERAVVAVAGGGATGAIQAFPLACAP